MRKTLLVAISLTAVFGEALLGQISVDPGWVPLQTADQLRALAGSEPAAATTVSAAIRDFIRIMPTKTASVVAAQIPEKWLPASLDVQFVRLSDEAARAHFQQCGRLLFVRSTERPSSDGLVISVAEGNKCHSTTLRFRFSLTTDGWRLEPGVRGGVAGNAFECSCPPAER